MAKRSATEERQPRCQPVLHHMRPEHSSFGVSLIFHPPWKTLSPLAAGQLCSPGQDQGQGGRWTAGRDMGRATALFLWPHCTRWWDLSTPSANFPPPPPADHVSQNKAEQETRSASGGPEGDCAVTPSPPLPTNAPPFSKDLSSFGHLLPSSPVGLPHHAGQNGAGARQIAKVKGSRKARGAHPPPAPPGGEGRQKSKAPAIWPGHIRTVFKRHCA